MWNAVVSVVWTWERMVNRASGPKCGHSIMPIKLHPCNSGDWEENAFSNPVVTAQREAASVSLNKAELFGVYEQGFFVWNINFSSAQNIFWDRPTKAYSEEPFCLCTLDFYCSHISKSTLYYTVHMHMLTWEVNGQDEPCGSVSEAVRWAGLKA